MGVIVAIFAYKKIDMSLNIYGSSVREIVSIGAFIGVTLLLYSIAKKRVIKMNILQALVIIVSPAVFLWLEKKGFTLFRLLGAVIIWLVLGC